MGENVAYINMVIDLASHQLMQENFFNEF